MWYFSKFKAILGYYVQNFFGTENIYLLLYLQNSYTNQASTDNRS